MPNYTIGQDNHLWGSAPLHFQDSFYEYASKAIDIITKKDNTHTLQQLYNEQSLNNKIFYDNITSQLQINELKNRIDELEKRISKIEKHSK